MGGNYQYDILEIMIIGLQYIFKKLTDNLLYQFDIIIIIWIKYNPKL